MRKLNVLLLCNRPARGADASTVTDHLDAFRRFSRNSIFELSFIRELPSRLALERFDVLAIHYSTALGYYVDHYISPAARQRVRDFPGLKVAFIQDEYRMIDRVHEVLRFLGIDILFTCVPAPEIEKVYPADKLPGLIKINNLTGYVPEALLSRPVAPIAERPIDVGYRTRRMPYWLGALGFEKSWIADQFAERARSSGFRLDISCDEADRLYGEKWTQFVASCKAMLGVESGASVFDFTGDLQKQVDAYIAAHPQASFEEVQTRFLLPHEGKIRLNQISPRCFEAAALRTAMVMSPDRGGVFDVLLGMTRLGLGGSVAGGRQQVSWIHERDFVCAVERLLADDGLEGAINVCAPNPLPHRDFMAALRAAAGVRIGLPATRLMAELGAFVLRTDTELLFKSRYVVPRRLLDAGFVFEHGRWPEAARELVGRWRAGGST